MAFLVAILKFAFQPADIVIQDIRTGFEGSQLPRNSFVVILRICMVPVRAVPVPPVCRDVEPEDVGAQVHG
jgi:hypothetical protein